MIDTRRAIALGMLIAALATAAACGNPAAPRGNYGTIVGTVKSASGQPISGASVTADSVITTQTAADGKYTLDTVPIDSASTTTTVTAHAAGFQDASDHVTVSTGKQVEADFTLNSF